MKKEYIFEEIECLDKRKIIRWAMLDYSINEFEQARRHVTKAIAIDPSIAYPYTTLAEINHYEGNIDSFYYYCNIAQENGYEFTILDKDPPYSEYRKDPKHQAIVAKSKSKLKG